MISFFYQLQNRYSLAPPRHKFFPTRFISKIKRESKARYSKFQPLFLPYPDISYFRTGIKLPTSSSFAVPYTVSLHLSAFQQQNGVISPSLVTSINPLKRRIQFHVNSCKHAAGKNLPYFLPSIPPVHCIWGRGGKEKGKIKREKEKKKKKNYYTQFLDPLIISNSITPNSTSKSDLPVTGKQFSFDVQGLH